MEGAASKPLIDLDESIGQRPWSLFQKTILLFAALAFAVDGWADQVLGVAMPALIPELGGGHGRAAFASVAAIGLVGVALGTAIGGFAGDRFGRRVTLIGSVVLFGAATFLASQSHTVGTLGAIRFVDGLGLGAAIPNGAALVADYTPLRRRSLAIGFCMTFKPVGGVLSGLAGSLLLPGYGWRMLFMVTGGAALALALFFFFVLPESPGFLLQRPHRKAELLKILSRFGYGFSSDTEFRRDWGVKKATPVAGLFGREIRRDTIALWAGFFACLMASYSMFSWLPTLLSDRGFGLAQASLGMTGFNTGGIFGGILAGLALTAFGSRVPSVFLALGAAVGAVALSMIPLHPLHGMGLTLTTFAIEGALVSGLQTALYALAASVYPPFVRATGIGSAAAFGRLGAVASSYTGVIALTLAKGSFYFVYIACLITICGIAIFLIKRHTLRSEPIEAPA